ncbi:MAG: hypothetical protein WCJ35_08655 [Planctomycetota bacterium]
MARKVSMQRSSVPPQGSISPIALGVLSIGPLLLAIVAGVQFMMAAWETWLRRIPSPIEVDRLTIIGKCWYQPDQDLPIYVVGIVGILILATAMVLAWQRRVANTHSENHLRFMRWLLWIHFPVAGFFVLLPMLWLGAVPLTWISASLAMATCGALLLATYFETLGMPAGLRLSPAAQYGVQSCVAVGLIVLLVYMPDITLVTGWIYQLDKFHHWDFYVMAPALAFRHGAALGTEFYCQYGVAWPMLLAQASAIVPLTYKMAIHFAVVFGCAYFLAVYFLFRLLLKSTPWALTGLLLTLFFQLFSGTDGLPNWCYPSSTVLRSSLDLLLFVVCLAYARRNRAWLGLPAGVLLGLVTLFSTDTGVYLSAALVMYMLAVPRLQTGAIGPRKGWIFILGVVAGLAGTLILGLAIASRGTLLHSEFWRGWLEPLLVYGGGIGQLPIGGAVVEWSAYLLFTVELLVYLFFFGRVLDKSLRKTLSPEDLILGMIAVYGLGTIMIFIGRSHPFNLYHSSVPFCILLTSAFAWVGTKITRSLKFAWPTTEAPLLGATLRTAPWVCVYLALIAVCSNNGYQHYPNLLHWAFRDQYVARPADNYLFAQRRDVLLPENLRPMAQRFTAITDAITKLSEGGRNSIAVIDFADTHFLVQADLKPYFRYSPLIASLHFKEQIDLVERQLADCPPDYVLIPDQAPMTILRVQPTDVYDRLLTRVNQRYTLLGNVYDMKVFKRNP